jgi:hypothetical protein
VLSGKDGSAVESDMRCFGHGNRGLNIDGGQVVSAKEIITSIRAQF